MIASVTFCVTIASSSFSQLGSSDRTWGDVFFDAFSNTARKNAFDSAPCPSHYTQTAQWEKEVIYSAFNITSLPGPWVQNFWGSMLIGQIPPCPTSEGHIPFRINSAPRWMFILFPLHHLLRHFKSNLFYFFVLRLFWGCFDLLIGNLDPWSSRLDMSGTKLPCAEG
jgi:hypothetical protein